MSCPSSPRTRMRPMGPGSPMPAVSRPRAFLEGGQQARSGRWPSRVWMMKSSLVRAAMSTCSAGGTEQRDVVAEGLTEAAGIDEVALEVDHQERGGLRMELELVGLGGDGGHGAFLPGASMLAYEVVTTAGAGSGRID